MINRKGSDLLKFEETEVFNIEGAVRGMRNPLDSWSKSDSYSRGYERVGESSYVIGPKDLELMVKLKKAGHPHRKYLRQILVSVDVTAPLYWWKEFDTYKVGTTRNSCSTMHTIHVKPFRADMFAHDAVDKLSLAAKIFEDLLYTLEKLRELYNTTKDKVYWRAIIQLLPESFEMKATLTMNYENILNMIEYRQGHKLIEWSKDFMVWARMLPYSSELLFGDDANE